MTEETIQGQTTSGQSAAEIYAGIDRRVLDSGLSIRELAFVGQYFEKRSIRDAAVAAGYAESTARIFAPQWLDETSISYKPKVHAAIRMKQEAVAAAESLSIHELIGDLKNVVFTDPLDFFDSKTGAARSIKEIPQPARMAIEDIELTVLQTRESGDRIIKVKYKLRDKDAATEKLMKYLGAYERGNQRQSINYVVLPVPIPTQYQAASEGLSNDDEAKVVTDGQAIGFVGIAHGRGHAPLENAIDVARRRNIAEMERSNKWVVENGLDDPIEIDD